MSGSIPRSSALFQFQAMWSRQGVDAHFLRVPCSGLGQCACTHVAGSRDIHTQGLRPLIDVPIPCAATVYVGAVCMLPEFVPMQLVSLLSLTCTDSWSSTCGCPEGYGVKIQASSSYQSTSVYWASGARNIPSPCCCAGTLSCPTRELAMNGCFLPGVDDQSHSSQTS